MFLERLYAIERNIVASIMQANLDEASNRMKKLIKGCAHPISGPIEKPNNTHMRVRIACMEGESFSRQDRVLRRIQAGRI